MRLPDHGGQKVDADRPLSFTFNGQVMRGLTGDTAAAALYANGVRIFSRSLKYHRPRGLYSLDGESANCFMKIDGLPNTPAETTPLAQNMSIAPQNYWGSLNSDALSIFDQFHRFMPAGFYYHRFHRPYRLWPFFRDQIRKAAGIGRINPQWTPGRYEHLYLNADLAVVGGGPAGLSAALAAADQGLRVALFEARPFMGGFYDWRTAESPDGRPFFERVRGMIKDLTGRDNVRVFTAATVTGCWGDNLLTVIQDGGDGDHFDQRYLQVRAGAVVSATGCGERPLVFEHNERPGVMQPSCAWRLARTYGVVPGETAVFSVGDDLGLEAAADLADLGVHIAAVADARLDGGDPDRVTALSERKIDYFPGWAVNRAEGAKGVRGAHLASMTGPGAKSYECDLIAASAGPTPWIGLMSTAGAKMFHEPYSNFFLPQKLPPRFFAAGRLLALTHPESIETSGRVAGLSAAQALGVDVEAPLREALEMQALLPGPVKGCALSAAPGVGRGEKSFVCFDEDATIKHVGQAVEEGFDVPELTKRYTAIGTGPGQGGVPGHNLPLLVDEFREKGLGEVAPTTIRPPLAPTLMATLAGPKHDVYKATPLEKRQAEAVFHRIGPWKRARRFGPDKSSRDEIMAVRERVGLIDVSTLGKFRLFGPDAVKALERVYVGHMAKTPSEKVKYSAMVNDDGCLMDDGVVTQIAENDYYFTTSTGRAGQTVEWFRYHARYEDWDFHLVNLTDALAAINLAGPYARHVLSKLTDEDLSNDAFPYMGFRRLTLKGGVWAYCLRVGFVGELSYEVHLPAGYAAWLWDRLLEAGADFNIRPFGLEAQNVLRLEKGHIIIGQESETRTTLHDLGLGGLWYRGKPEARTVGAPALRFTENQEGRRKLVGFQTYEPAPREGSLVVDQRIRGHVASCRYSPSLQYSVGLALVDEDLALEGTELSIFQDGAGDARLKAVVARTPFYDPEGRRLKM